MEYLNCVLKETLRIQPPAFLMPDREVNETNEFEGILLEKGVNKIYYNRKNL